MKTSEKVRRIASEIEKKASPVVNIKLFYKDAEAIVNLIENHIYQYPVMLALRDIIKKQL